jgi:hypothetical protein
MPNHNAQTEIIDQLSSSISDDVGNMHEEDLDAITQGFDKTLTDALRQFNSSVFDDDGFIKKMRDLDLGTKDKEVVKNVLNTVRSDYVTVESLNQTELLLRRDITNICQQMPEMRDVIYVIRDSIIECNVATGQVSRTLKFENHEDNEELMSQAKAIEESHNLLMAIKNFIVPNTLKAGEMYIQVVPYAKLFAEIEALHDQNFNLGKSYSLGSSFHESCPNGLVESFDEKSKSLYTERNLKILMEAASHVSMSDDSAEHKVDNPNGKTSKMSDENVAKNSLRTVLENIEVYNGASPLMAELGPEGFAQFVTSEYMESTRKDPKRKKKYENHFMEAMDYSKINNGIFKDIDQDDVDISNFKDIKGCYIKYLDTLRMVPIRVDRRIIGYYYISTTMDLQNNPAQPNGIIDLSFQNYVRDKNMVEQLSQLIVNSFDKRMLEHNIKLKNEIAEIIMAHKFSEGKLTFIYIPENEVIRFVINEDEEGRGHSVIEPTIFPARMYLMLTMYNMIYTLNNNTTRIHYLRSSGLNKDYAAQIQRTMRKFQSRRITIDDIYSFSGVLNKVGGMGEMVLPSGRNDYKALETDTIEAVNNPINMEFLEQQRRQAISGTGVPHLMMINAIDEADFAKTLEMANARFISTVSSYKIDFNRSLTKFYQRVLRWDTDLDADEIQSFSFKFNEVKQQDLVITADMIQNFNQLYELVSAVYYSKAELEDDKGNPTAVQKYLKKALAKKYLGQLDFDELDELVKQVDIDSKEEGLQDKVNETQIEDEDLKEIEDKF